MFLSLPSSIPSYPCYPSTKFNHNSQQLAKILVKQAAMATTPFLGSTAIASPTALSLGELKAQSPCRVNVQQQRGTLVVKASATKDEKSSRRRDVLGLAAAVLVGGLVAGAVAGEAKAGLVEDLLAKTAANKELNDKKRLATSGANFARAYTVQFNTCKFPQNFTGCQDLAKTKDVKFLSDDLKLECEGKDKYKCGSNVFWKWGSK